MGRWLGWTLSIAGLVSVCSAALGQAQPTSEPANPAPFLDPDAPKPWTIQIEPVVWFAGPNGKVKLPVASGSGPGPFTTEGDKIDLASLELDNTRLSPAGEAHINADNWRFTLAGADYSTSQPGSVSHDTLRIGSVVLAPGDRFDSSFSLGIYELTAGYCVWDHDFQHESENPEDAVPVLVRLYVLGGCRAYDTSFSVRRTSGAPALAESTEFFVEPIAGARVEADFTKTFGIDLQLCAGGWPVGAHSSFSFDISLGFHYRPFENVGVQLGYRIIRIGLQDGTDLSQFRYDGTLAGLYTGIVIRF